MLSVRTFFFLVGVSGWRFPLVPAHPSSPGQRAIKWLCVLLRELVSIMLLTWRDCCVGRHLMTEDRSHRRDARNQRCRRMVLVWRAETQPLTMRTTTISGQWTWTWMPSRTCCSRTRHNRVTLDQHLTSSVALAFACLRHHRPTTCNQCFPSEAID